ncbi:glycosyltransferase [Runella sp.]|uniref:glycosyltransferase n=1 Tax=Runella sp. TaxID=1960881 RepID=UPI003D0C2565
MKDQIQVDHTNYLTLTGIPKIYPENRSEILPALWENNNLPDILFITSYPPRECGIATYSQDLKQVLDNKFNRSFNIQICPLESESENHVYAESPKYVLNTDRPNAFLTLAKAINEDVGIHIVVVQHEFGFFEKKEGDFQQFLEALTKPVIIVFHTVLPHPNSVLKVQVENIAAIAESIVVMTHYSADVLIHEYAISAEKITVIAHGTHLVPHSDREGLKRKHQLTGKKVLSTFGLLSSGKSIETTLEALPAIVRQNPEVLFLIIGKTHPSVVKQEGEKYRNMLEERVKKLQLQSYVRFVNYFLPLPDLLEYLQLTDVYLFTSKDPNQAVSGTFSYAISSGCAIVSTPIPHAREVLQNDAGIIIDFQNSAQLSVAVNSLLNDEKLRQNISSNALHRMASTAWENAAIAHAMLFEKMDDGQIALRYNLPAINLDHVKKMTTEFGMIQFSTINQPDIGSGYTLDDNARAMVAMCQHFEQTLEKTDVAAIQTYFHFIKYCLQPDGNFLNYVDEQKAFTEQNNETNLADANGRAIWALGYLISMSDLLPKELTAEAEATMQAALVNVKKIHSTRAMAFAVKGLYYSNTKNKSPRNTTLIVQLANRLVQMYRHEATHDWRWFESYLTYANSILPEAMLCAWIDTGDGIYKEIAKESFDFLLSKTFRKNNINVISNKSWLQKGEELPPVTVGGEQPIDVAYTILALSKFYDVFRDESYLQKLLTSFEWFLGNNHLHQIIYNPRTGGCYDGLEENYVNLNQGAESTVSYLMARLTVKRYFRNKFVTGHFKEYSLKLNRQN